MSSKRPAPFERPTPICGECTNLYEHKKGIVFKKVAITLCSAQGYLVTSQAYNTPECRKLYTNKTKEAN
jgi:hypothetical protein